MTADIEQQRELVDELDGENRAVRTFLLQYSCDRSTTVGAMLAHMNRSGWRGLCPAWVLEVRPETHLTKGGAQSWIRHLFGLESGAAPSPEGQAEQQATDENAALDLLDAMYSAWENGVSCYEDPDENQGYLGNAFRMDDETERACMELLDRRRPRQTTFATEAAPKEPT
jgi:hypothetical protein